MLWRTLLGILGSLRASNLMAWLRNLLGLLGSETRTMADFTFVTSRIATGAALNDASDVDAIVAAGITAVIDLRDDFDDGRLLAAHPAIIYCWNPTPDDGQPKPPEWFDKSLTFALPILARPHTKVLAHCSAGINRGPSTAYAVMVALSFPPAVAERMIRNARPIVGLAYAVDAQLAATSLGYV